MSGQDHCYIVVWSLPNNLYIWKHYEFSCNKLCCITKVWCNISLNHLFLMIHFCARHGTCLSIHFSNVSIHRKRSCIMHLHAFFSITIALKPKNPWNPRLFSYFPLVFLNFFPWVQWPSGIHPINYCWSTLKINYNTRKTQQ